ncbi:hypothetical protein GCM10011391_06260 [Pullulanibacillus camelliae]|uniref:Aldolase n=1 Tax=Pullulanibacillus camelliae TaxID=1707096 RepID=A0A8J2VL62_9BACL|nr:aldolase [Pullulanibacillus camelliae]GGE30392.1 hypothetical protein GCM10011391_06260 [Pullulanibacillus camelliae]
MRFYHKAFGLTIESQWVLPEVPAAIVPIREADVRIEQGDLSQLCGERASLLNKYVTLPGKVYFKVADTALFLIEEGRKIVVSPFLGCDVDKLRLYILGTCMGILLLQRKILPLHGSVIAINDKAYAFVGDRGAGKSTLAAAFLQRGYRLLTDDVIAVVMEKGDFPYVVPSYPQQKLWQESLNRLNMKSEAYEPLFERETKYAIPVTDQFISEPLPLAGMFELTKTEAEGNTLQHLKGLACLDSLSQHTYRHFLIPRMGLIAWHFHMLTRLVERIKGYQLTRSTQGFTVDQLVSMVLMTISEEDECGVNQSKLATSETDST